MFFDFEKHLRPDHHNVVLKLIIWFLKKYDKISCCHEKKTVFELLVNNSYIYFDNTPIMNTVRFFFFDCLY